MPRKRFNRDSGPRSPSECHAPTGPTGGSSIGFSSGGFFPTTYITAPAGQDTWRLYAPNTSLPWTQASVRFGTRAPSGFENQWNPTGATGPCLGSAAAVIASSGSMDACAFGEISLVATAQAPRPVIQFSGWNDLLCGPAMYLYDRFVGDNASKAAESHAKLLDCDYCTKPLPSLTSYRSTSRHVFFFETRITLGTKAEEAARFVDAFSIGSGTLAVCATPDEESGTSRIGLRANASGAPPNFLAVVPASPFEYLRQGSYLHLDRVPVVSGWSDSPTNAQIRIPSGYISSPVTKIGRYTFGTRPQRSYESWAVGNIQFQMWRNGEELDLSAINSNQLLFYGEYADVSAFTAEEGAYRFRVAYADINFNFPYGTLAGPSRYVPLDYGVEFGWVQDFTRPGVAIQCLPSAVTASPKYFSLSSTEPLGTGTAYNYPPITRDGTVVGNCDPFFLNVNIANGTQPGKYRADFSGWFRFDLAGNQTYPVNDVEWEVYAIPTGPTGPTPPIAGWIEGVTGVMPSVDELTLRFSAPVTGAAEAVASLSVNGAEPESLSIVGAGDTYRIIGLSDHFEPGKSYFLSVPADECSPADDAYERVAGPVCAAWVTQADGPPEVPSLDTARWMAVIGNEYSISAVASVPGVDCDNTDKESEDRRDLVGYRITTAANSLPALVVESSGKDETLSAASIPSALQFPTGPAATGPQPVEPPPTGPTGPPPTGPTGPSEPPPSLASAATAVGVGETLPLTLRSDRLYESRSTVVPQDLSRGLAYAIAMTAPHRHAQWSAGLEATKLEIEIKAEDYTSHPYYTKATEIGTASGFDTLTDCWSAACLAGTYTLENKIGEKPLVPCQYYAETTGTETFEFEQGPPNIPAGEEMESTGEISLDPDWVTLYEKAIPDEPNNVAYGSEGIFIGWQSWPPGASSPTPAVPIYLANLKGSASGASFSDDGEESRQFVEDVMGGSATSLPEGSTKAQYDDWSEDETGILADFYDERYQGTAKTWKVKADSIQVIAKIAREVPIAVSRCGDIHGNLGLLRVYVRLRAMYTVDINPVRLWKVKWRARPLLSYAAQDRSRELTGVTLSTTYWVMQGRRIVIDNIEQKTTRSTKRERFFAFDFLLSQAESAQLEAGEDISRKIEIMHEYGSASVPQIIEVILRLPAGQDDDQPATAPHGPTAPPLA